ncbi:MAG: hypothetical protein PHG80_12170, partial [Methanoregulaceae archaeon]|nr:hypothetical protein [Methanoregulaceae archaeon]
VLQKKFHHAALRRGICELADDIRPHVMVFVRTADIIYILLSAHDDTGEYSDPYPNSDGYIILSEQRL